MNNKSRKRIYTYIQIMGSQLRKLSDPSSSILPPPPSLIVASEYIMKRLEIPNDLSIARSTKILISIRCDEEELYYNFFNLLTFEEIKLAIYSITDKLTPTSNTKQVTITFGFLIKLSDDKQPLYSHNIQKVHVIDGIFDSYATTSSSRVYSLDNFEFWSSNISLKNKGPQIDINGDFII
jgi:hypothetical protein